MKIENCRKGSFAVIGREGCTTDGDGFIAKLWQEANSHFDEIAHLVKRDAEGTPVGFWGAMSDVTRSFLPWQNNFSEGLYLAGAECPEDAAVPQGWTKWVVPAHEYLRVECGEEDVFGKMIAYLRENHLALAGAVHDFTDPSTGKNYMYFPIKKL